MVWAVDVSACIIVLARKVPVGRQSPGRRGAAKRVRDTLLHAPVRDSSHEAVLSCLLREPVDVNVSKMRPLRVSVVPPVECMFLGAFDFIDNALATRPRSGSIRPFCLYKMEFRPTE